MAQSAKDQLRDKSRVLRDAIAPPDAQRWSERAAGYLVNIVRRLDRNGVIGGYHPRGSEADCTPALQEFQGLGWKLALPTIPKKTGPLVFRRYKVGDMLMPAPFGTQEPMPDEPEVRPAILIVPLLAYDAQGYRLGYGAGYYDRTIEKLRGEGSLLAVGFAYSCQEVDSLPVEPHDERLDWVVTEKGARPYRSDGI